jgi:hypothetical protein
MLISGSLALAPLAVADFARAGQRDLQIEQTAPAHHPHYHHRPQAAFVRPADRARPTHVGLTPIGPSILRIGQPIRFRAWSNHAGFGQVYLATASGKVMLLAENLPLRANRPVALPARGLTLRAVAPAGDDSLIFVATRARFNGFAGGVSTSAPIDLQTSAGGLIQDLKSRLSATPDDDWGFTTVVVRVVE